MQSLESQSTMSESDKQQTPPEKMLKCDMHYTAPVMVPNNSLNVDLLIEAMKAMFKELNPSAGIDQIIQIFERHVQQAEQALAEGDNELQTVEET